MRPDRVLLVDDEVEFVETLAERMRARGLEVATATNGAEALRLAEQENFDAVGIETLEHMLRRQPDLQVMLLTGQATVQKAVEATRLGAIEVFEKPTDIETLIGKIREARAQRLNLVEQRTQLEIEEILRSRGW
jgi:DNA-binding NtrC family response regulator